MALPKGIYDFHDTTATRKRIFDKVTTAFRNTFPKQGRSTVLELQDLSIPDKDIPLSVQKKHIMEGRDLTVPLKGTVVLKDKATGKVLDRKKQTITQVPYYTGRGTFILGGNDYAGVNQFRLNPGVYARWKENGDLESHFNLQHGSGLSFRAFFEPSTAIFRLNVGQANLKLYPLLRAMGIRHGDIARSWGTQIADINAEKGDDPTVIKKFYDKLVGWKAKPGLTQHEMGQEVVKELAKAKMDPNVNRVTLGGEFSTITPKVFLRATDKLLKINRGEEKADDRDSVGFRRVYDVADYISEKVQKDSGGLGRVILRKVDSDRSLKSFTPGYFSRQVKNGVITDSRIQPVEEVNPVELFDYQERIISTGEGGISSVEAIPDSARNVHPSQLGYIDLIRGPESMHAGVDVRASYKTYKGDDGRLYTRAYDRKGGKPLVPADKLFQAVVAFPGQRDKKDLDVVKVMDGQGVIKDAKRSEVDYWLPDGQGMFSHVANLVPGINSTEGRRLLMGSKFQVQALPLVNGERPLVMNKVPGKDIPFERVIGRKVGARLAKVTGTVTKITPDDIYIKSEETGESIRHGLYNNFSLNRKTYIHQTPLVKVGDSVREGQVLAKSNFTDENGDLAIGRNLVTAYMPFKGYSVEDGIVISETAAKKLTSDMMYTVSQPLDSESITGKKKFISNMPATFNKQQLDILDDDGVVKPGTKLMYGDPITIALHKKPLSSTDMMLGKLHKSLRNFYTDKSHVWEHETDGEVVDVAKTSKGYTINIKTQKPMTESDKLANRYGGKGVVGKVLSDEQMPIIESTGQRVEVLFNPLGVPTRINPMQIYETLLGKVVEKTGKPYFVEPFSDKSRVAQLKDEELKKYGISEQEWLINPDTGKRYKNPILAGKEFFTKSFKTSESGFSTRELGAYTAEERPAKGGKEGAKKIGNLLINTLLGHGALENLREMATIKGAKNLEFWKALKLGQPLPSPQVPFIYKKFENYLKAAGANLRKTGQQTQILPMTRQEVEQLAGLPIKNDRLLKAKDMQPEKGGLFDFAITGGPTGQRWSHIPLVEPLPNPVMEEPIRRLLGVTQKKYEGILAGTETVNGVSGGKGIQQVLGALDIDQEMAKAKAEIASGRKSKRDDAVKKLQYLTMFKQSKIRPEDLVVDKWPVIPPQYRPIAVSGFGNSVVVSSPNLLYKDLLQTTEAYRSLQKELPDDQLAQERLAVYKAIKAVSGLGDPVNIKTKKKQAKGFLKEVIGDSPKFGMYQAKVLGKTQDIVSRAVALPDPALNIDQIGVPEKALWTMFKPFVMRRLVRRGMSALAADKAITEQQPVAQKALEEETAVRPVLMDRAPALHKFNMMAGFAVPRKDTSIGFPVSTAPVYNADFDGDQLNLHVPVTEGARKEAITKMLPSNNLFSIKEHTVHFTPLNESVLGLHYASRPPVGKPTKKFKTASEAIAAYQTGDLKLNEAIEVEYDDL